MPRPRRRVSDGATRRRTRPPTSTLPWSGWTNPLATPSSVDFPDPFSPTRAWISPARHSTLTSSSACTAPKAFEMPWSPSTTELIRRASWRSVAGVRTAAAGGRLCRPEGPLWRAVRCARGGAGGGTRVPPPRSLPLRVHLLEQAQRDQRRRRGLLRISLDAGVTHALVLELDREHDLRRDLRALQLHHRRRERHADLRVARGVVEHLQLRVLELVERAAHTDVVRPEGQHGVERLARCLVGRERPGR